jgi:hypothetical protein
MTKITPPGFRHVLIPQARPAAGQVVQVAYADPPPPQYVRGPMTTQYSDVYAADQAQIARNTVTNEKLLVQELLRAARGFNVTVAPPAHIKPHIWSEPVDQSAQVVVAAGAVSAFQTVCTFTTPPGRWARIEHYGVLCTDPAYTYDGELLWAFRLNGRLLDQGMSNWGEQRGDMVFMRPTVILMNNEGIKLDFMVRRAVAGINARTVQMAFRGWTYRLRNNYEGTQGSVTAY